MKAIERSAIGLAGVLLSATIVWAQAGGPSGPAGGSAGAATTATPSGNASGVGGATAPAPAPGNTTTGTTPPVFDPRIATPPANRAVDPRTGAPATAPP